jgi:hypothetical protein
MPPPSLLRRLPLRFVRGVVHRALLSIDVWTRLSDLSLFIIIVGILVFIVVGLLRRTSA